ncbi:MAG: efflux RND transporter periplasmic adaptor subunit [Deltaproteobacteria bacterium]|nr:efflux RND transporter periplasmic adaptor subunit [Deltaproteobacteria bacterium]
MKAITYFSLIWLSLAGCQQPPPAPAPIPVRTAQVRVGPVVEGLRALGTVSPARSVNLLAQVQGVVADLPVAEGGAVEAGAPLVLLTSPELAARLSRVSAERQRAESERDHACGRLEVDRRLGAAGDVPSDRVDQSERACRGASLAAEAAAAAEDEVRAIAARRAERAPFDGVLLDALVDVGQAVMPGTPLAAFGSREQVLVAHLSTGDLSRGVGPGSPVRIEVPGGAPIRSQVLAVGSRAVGPAKTVEVRVALPGGGLLTGAQRGLLFVEREVEEQGAVPAAALFVEDGRQWITVVQGGHPSALEVTAGPRQDGWVAVSPSPPAGSKVVLGLGARLPAERELFTVEVSR